MKNLYIDVQKCLTVMHHIIYDPFSTPWIKLDTHLHHTKWQENIRYYYEKYLSQSTAGSYMYSSFQLRDILNRIAEGRWISMSCIKDANAHNCIFIPALIQRVPDMNAKEIDTFVEMYIKFMGIDHYLIQLFEDYELLQKSDTVIFALLKESNNKRLSANAFIDVMNIKPSFGIQLTTHVEVHRLLASFFDTRHLQKDYDLHQKIFHTIFQQMPFDYQRQWFKSIDQQKIFPETFKNDGHFLFMLKIMTIMHQYKHAITQDIVPYFYKMEQDFCHIDTHKNFYYGLPNPLNVKHNLLLTEEKRKIIMEYRETHMNNTISWNELFHFLWENKHNTLWTSLSLQTQKSIIQQIQQWDETTKQNCIRKLLAHAYVDQRRYEHFPLLKILGFKYPLRKLVSSARQELHRQYGIPLNPHDLQKTCAPIAEALFDNTRTAKDIMLEQLYQHLNMDSQYNNHLIEAPLFME